MKIKTSKFVKKYWKSYLSYLAQMLFFHRQFVSFRQYVIIAETYSFLGQVKFVNKES